MNLQKLYELRNRSEGRRHDQSPADASQSWAEWLATAAAVIRLRAEVEITLKCSAAKAEQVRPIIPFDARRRTI